MKNGIIIPCYNEADRLDLTSFSNFIDSHDDYMLCFVNDGSKDNTLDILNAFQNGRSERVEVYDMPQNSGKAEAVRSGACYLAKKFNVQTIGFLDADLSTDFEDYKILVGELSQNRQIKTAIGSRNMSSDKGGEIERNPIRKLISDVIGMMIRMILGLNINDTQCGAKVFRTEVVESCFNRNFISRWLFDIEIFIRMKHQYGTSEMEKRIKEVPLNRWVHVEGSKLGLKDSLNIPMQLGKIAFQYNFIPMIASAQGGLKMSLGFS